MTSSVAMNLPSAQAESFTRVVVISSTNFVRMNGKRYDKLRLLVRIPFARIETVVTLSLSAEAPVVSEKIKARLNQSRRFH